MNYLIFMKKDEDSSDFIIRLKKIARKLNMINTDKDFYSTEYPIHQIKLNYISDSEFETRKKIALENSKIEIKEYQNAETCELYFYGTEKYCSDGDYIFRFLNNDTPEYALIMIFYENQYKENIIAFLESESEKKLFNEMENEHTLKSEPIKYTRFRDIPQLTRSGSWEVDFSLIDLVHFIDKEIIEDGLDMNPDFQRGHVWTEQQQISFIEFFLRGGRTGRVIYLNKPDWNRSVEKDAYNEFVCVDGLQRYTAIKRFVNNEIKVFGSYYSEYEDNIRGTTTMRVNINDLKTKKDVLQWYLDFNSGGTVHSQDELDRVKELLLKEI